MAKILISYRRLEATVAGRLYDALTSYYGSEFVGIDYTQAEAGTDFRSHLLEATRKCDVLLVLIGPHWRGIKQGEKLSIENDFDPIRQEVAVALQMRKAIIPILTEGVTMPAPEQLPEDIRTLSFQNAVQLGSSTFKADVALLIKVLDARSAIQTRLRSLPAHEAQGVAQDKLIPSADRQAAQMDRHVETVMAFDVFISYPHQNKAVADAACAKLEAEGLRCWIAPRDIAPSAEWAASIVEAIDNCRAMVLIFSTHSNGSKQVHREVQQAFDGEKPVIPFRIDNVMPEKSLRYYMGSVHWLDALTPPIEGHLEQLVRSVSALVGETPAKEQARASDKDRAAFTAHQAEETRKVEEERAKSAAGRRAIQKPDADAEAEDADKASAIQVAREEPHGDAPLETRTRDAVAQSKRSPEHESGSSDREPTMVLGAAQARATGRGLGFQLNMLIGIFGALLGGFLIPMSNNIPGILINEFLGSGILLFLVGCIRR